MIANSIWATAAACGAAAAYAVATLSQHRAARASRPRRSLDPRLLVELLARPLWLIGGLADLVGLGLQTLALSWGALALVEPLIACGVLITIPVDALLDHRRIEGKAVVAAVIGSLGLAAFVLASQPRGSDHPSLLAVALSIGLSTAGIGICVLIGRVTSRHVRATMLGLAAGTAYASSASLIKVLTGQAGLHFVVILTSWPTYALIAMGVLGLILNQNAFQVRPLQPALVALSLSTPVISTVIGILAFGEHWTGGPARQVISFAAAIAIAGGVVGSAQLAEPTPDNTRGQGNLAAEAGNELS